MLSLRCLRVVSGPRVLLLDPDAIRVARFSRWLKKGHRCSHGGADPLACVESLERVVEERRIDVVPPTALAIIKLRRQGAAGVDAPLDPWAVSEADYGSRL